MNGKVIVAATVFVAACGAGYEPSPDGSVTRVGSAGGSIVADGGRFSLSVPPGALSAPMDLQIDSVSTPNDPDALPRTRFVLGPATVTFLKPATATIRYDAGLDARRESSVGMYADSSGFWQVIPGSTASAVTHTVSAPVAGAGRFALLALGPVDTVTVIPNSVTVVLGTTQVLACQLHDSLGNTLTNRPIAWTSDDTTVIQVDAVGRLFPISIGQTIVTATSGGVSGRAGVSAAFICSCPGRSSLVTTTAGACTC